MAPLGEIPLFPFCTRYYKTGGFPYAYIIILKYSIVMQNFFFFFARLLLLYFLLNVREERFKLEKNEIENLNRSVKKTTSGQLLLLQIQKLC